ncbi:MAG TPA: 2-hydroxymuconate tautomerase [Kofleriaceae bacterium]|nr:2-hydroxymuconate tautomerase [Kofleriaceae bacterium]
MPLVEVTLIEGRSREVKAALMKALTDAVEAALGAPRDSIRVIVREVPAENWAVGGVPKG